MGRLGCRDVDRAGPFASLLAATSPADVPVAGACRLFVDTGLLLTPLIALADSGGFAHFPIPVPLQPALRGFALSTQAAVLDLAANPPVIASAALDLRVGD